MKLYSDYAAQRTRQIIADLGATATIGLWVWLGVWVYRKVDALAEYGVKMESAGAGFRDTMIDIGDGLGGVPLIGGGIRVPFDAASAAGAELEAAGQAQQETVHQLAWALGIGICALPIVTVLVLWLIPRLRFARKAGNAKALVTQGAGVDLFALRAIMKQRPEALIAVHADPAGAWRRGDQDALAALASLELRRSGVRLARA